MGTARTMNVVELVRTLLSFHTEWGRGDEEECAKFLRDYFEDLHLDSLAADLHRFEPRRANLIVRIGSSKKPGLLLSGHMDTVSAGEKSHWTSDPFEARIKDGFLFGRGAADMKSGIASLVKAIESVKGKRLSRKLIFIGTAGEESGYHGLSMLMKDKRIVSDECIWGIDAEPTEMKVVRKHRGVTRFRVSLQGKNAHASTPELGVNAVEKASRFIEEIKRYRTKLADEIDPELGSTILPVTLIDGGLKGRYNVIPDKCVFFINCRRIPNHSAQKILKDLVSISDQLKLMDRNFSAEVEIDFDANTLQISPQNRLVLLAEDVVGGKSIAAPYATEASVYTEFGIPTIVLGPGSVEQAHMIDEFVSLKDIDRAVSAYEGLIQSLCL